MITVYYGKKQFKFLNDFMAVAELLSVFNVPLYDDLYRGRPKYIFLFDKFAERLHRKDHLILREGDEFNSRPRDFYYESQAEPRSEV